jgi:TolB-like protein/Flp pilus assembly protein TadD
MSKRNFFAELKRRNVYRAAMFYAAGGWLLVQIATQVFPFFDIPNWAVRVVVVAAIFGFPLALVFSWFYEWTPQGLKRESEVEPSASIMHATGKKMDRWIIAVLSLAIALLLADRLVLRRNTTGDEDKSIAVLPLVNESGDENNEYFSDGLTEELISALTHIQYLKVIGRNSSFRFKGHNQDSKTIGEKLGVAALLEGTVRKQADRLRIVVELVNAADGRELWSQSYDRELKDIFAVQSEIAQAVADSLQVTLVGASKTRLESSTGSADAHNAYLQGHFYLERNSFDSWPKAVAFYDAAIRFDPNYALAYAERAEAWSWIASRNPPDVAMARAAAGSDAEKSVALQPMLAEAHAALGWVRFYVDWNFAAAVAELRRAELLGPGNARSKYLLSQMLLYMGRIQEGSALARRAVELDPLAYAAHNNLARALTIEGRFDEAQAQGRKAAELQPGAVASHRWQVIAGVLHGDAEAALRDAESESSQASVRGPTQGFRHFELALAHYARGDRAEADATLAELIAQDGDSMDYQIAEVYAWRGEIDSAFEWLQHAFDTHDPGTLGTMTDPLLRGLHSDPRFAVMLGKLGLPTLM